jgi:hypothetical protein
LQEDRQRWGVLAHVSPEERERILALPFGQFRPEVARLEKEVKKAIQKARKRARW